jgi:hypothetical protein
VKAFFRKESGLKKVNNLLYKWKAYKKPNYTLDIDWGVARIIPIWRRAEGPEPHI